MRKPAPKVLRDLGVDDHWRGADDKWGPCCAVVIKDETKDATLVSGAFLKDKGVIPAPSREKNRYVINFKGKYGDEEKRVGSVPDAWRWIKSQLKSDPNFKVRSIENSYTYANPKIGQRTKKGKKVRVEFFGIAAE
jgi:hypothetical protein